MPSLESIANDVKAILIDVRSHTSDTKVNTAATAANVAQLNTTCQTGFANLAAGMAIQISLLNQANQMLFVNEKQNETIICWLKNIANVLCDIKYNTKSEVELQKIIARILDHLDKIFELVHSREAMEVLKHDELQGKIEVCCPPEKPKREPCFKECDAPHVPDYKPRDDKWEPVKYQTQKDK